MANTKKTVAKTEETTKDIQASVESEETVQAPTVESKPEPKKAVKPKHDPSELILCRSVTFGELLIIGPKTQLVYSWANDGDIREMEYQDLVSLKALRHKYLFEPFIVIEDEDLRKEWESDLGVVYSKLEDIDLHGIFDLPQRQFVARLKQLPAGVKTSLQNMAYTMIKDGTLYDLRKIQAMDEILNTELKLLI